jgi:hypothetical protein
MAGFEGVDIGEATLESDTSISERAAGVPARPSSARRRRSGHFGRSSAMRFASLGRAPALLLSLLLALGACGGPPAPNAPDSPEIEAEAKVAYDHAKSSEDPSKLLDVWQRFPKAPSGKKALFVAVDRYAVQAEKSARACKDDEARKILSTVAPYVTDEPSIDSKVDGIKEKVEKYKRKCRLDALDDAIEAAAKEWDWPKAFEAVDDDALAKDLDEKTISHKRDDVKKRWLAHLDRTLAEIVKRRSAPLVIDEHRQAWLSSLDAKNYPEDLREEIDARASKIAGVMLVFDKLDGGSLVDPPLRHWTLGTTKVRLAQTPDVDAKELPQGLSFVVVAQGKLGDQVLFAAGKEDGDELARLASIQFLVPEKNAKPWDTRILLPTKLASARVLAPTAPGSKELALHDVVEEKDGVVFATPVGRTNRVRFKRDELRAYYLPAGTKVTVSGKKGEVVTETTEGDAIAVRVNGADLTSPASGLRVERAALPRIPND